MIQNLYIIYIYICDYMYTNFFIKPGRQEVIDMRSA